MSRHDPPKDLLDRTLDVSAITPLHASVVAVICDVTPPDVLFRSE
jgi:hypothetical protein